MSPHDSHNEKPEPPASIISEFADDPDMQELVELFRFELPERIAALEASLDRGDTDALARLAHQLKGASAGYGFPTLGEAAAQVERDARHVPTDIHRLADSTNDLVDLCRRAA